LYSLYIGVDIATEDPLASPRTYDRVAYADPVALPCDQYMEPA
jgi:hypothetical protein